MKVYSGIYPLKFIPFRLDMSNDGVMSEFTNPVVDQGNEEQKQAQEKIKLEKDVQPESQAFKLSWSTEESVTAFIERTGSNSPTPQLEHPAQTTEESLPEIAKLSESEPLLVTVGQLPNVANQNAEEPQSETSDCGGLYSDTSDPGELFDSSRVDLPTAKPSTFTLDPDVFPDFDKELR